MPRVLETAVPTNAEHTNINFSSEETITLAGYDITTPAPQPGETLALTLFWETERPLHHSYTVFVHLVDPTTGEIIAQHDSLPRQGALPTTCWQPGEVVDDEHHLLLDSSLPAGEYLIQTGVYRLDLLQAGDPDHRLSVEQYGEISTFFDVTPIRIGNP